MLKKIILILSLFSIQAAAQKQANIWYFSNAGLNFNSGSPVALTDNQMLPWSTAEGTAVISDENGSLLFYTDGLKVWDKTQQVMSNSNGLNGNTSTSQGALIIPMPDSCGKYYLFTIDEMGHPKGFCYSVVDLSLNNGLGDVTLKNIKLSDTIAEKMTAIYKPNNKDVWVIVHGYMNDLFYSYLITSAGIQPPVITPIGKVINNTTDGVGQMKISTQGNRIAVATKLGDMQLYDFDISTGVLSNYMIFSVATPYGVEFSPDGSKLYCNSAAVYPTSLFQFDLSVNTFAAISASKTLVSPVSGSGESSIQLATDGKIYIAASDAKKLDVINNPNNIGAACNYSSGQVDLAGKSCGWGLPNFIQSYFGNSYQHISLDEVTYDNILGNDTSLCLGQPFQLTASYEDYTITWKDGSSDSSITVTIPGTYSVKLSGFCHSILDSIKIDFQNCDNPKIVIPNIYSPNADGVNDQFKFELHGIRNFAFTIYNRWGLELYVSNSAMEYWDGKLSSGKDAPDGVYYYVFEGETISRNEVSEKGFFTMIR